MKFFPAEAAGGTASQGPLPPRSPGPFLPDRRYLARLRAVLPGPAERRPVWARSWMVPGDAIAAKDWDRVARLAAEAAALGA
ncbi:2-dehydro-3-deoxy-phosphogluconate aldolase OS=Streptomyces microflavus OX=1919 GN=eda PE=3 SV=1 [Streptomyces microflavus]